MNLTIDSNFKLAKAARISGLFVLMLLATSLALADAVLTQVSGDVEIGRGQPTQWSTARAGDAMAPNDRVRTGANGRVEIEIGAGTLRVHENSMLRLPPANADADLVELEQGRSLFDVLRRKNRRFEVHTPTVVVSVKGTRFGVDAGIDIGEVTVYRGTVGIREVGASVMMETLVREGFLASGGIGVPIELDVSRAADPWLEWQAFNATELEQRVVPGRLNEIDRAKAALHRATAADVLSKAAQRRPEVAERIRQAQQKRGERARDADRRPDAVNDSGRKDGTAVEALRPMPAALDPAADPTKMGRGHLHERHLHDEARGKHHYEMQLHERSGVDVIGQGSFEQNRDLEEMMNVATLTGGTTLPSGETDLTIDTLLLQEVMALADALEDVRTQVASGTTVLTTSADFLTELERSLISGGMSTAEASTLINAISGP